jgi:sugar (pentulose or hexulose) kinase
MTHGPFVLGVDFGTESVRVGIFDLTGRPVTFAAETYPLYHPRPGWAEQQPDAWWQAFVTATRRALAQSGVPGAAIAGIGADCTSCTVVLMDEAFTPLRPAIIWMDVRAAEQANPHRPDRRPGAQIQWLRQRLGGVAAVQGAVGQGERAGSVGAGAPRR